MDNLLRKLFEKSLEDTAGIELGCNAEKKSYRNHRREFHMKLIEESLVELMKEFVEELTTYFVN